jgi:hypothetical protein
MDAASHQRFEAYRAFKNLLRRGLIANLKTQQRPNRSTVKMYSD